MPNPIAEPTSAPKAEPQSTSEIEDALGDIFHPEDITEDEVVDEVEDEEPDDLDDLDEPDTEPKVEGDEVDEVEVEFEGQLITAPKAVADALMRNKDYTEKTQAVAAQRKETEILQSEVRLRADQFTFAQQVQPDILKAQQLEADAASYHQYLKENVDTLTSVEVTKLQMAIADKREERDNLVQSLTNKQAQFQQAQKHTHEELLNKGTEVLRQKIPGWGKAQQEQVRSYALESGYTEAELSGVVDPRQVLTLWKAHQYDALKSGAVPAVKAVQSAPSIKAKSRNPMSQEKGRELNLRKKLKSTTRSDKQKAVDLEDHFAESLFKG